MSKTTASHHPFMIRIPTRITDDEPRDDSSMGSDQRIRELTAYRLARLEAEVLAPARGIDSVDLRLRRLISAYVDLAITDPGIMKLLSNEQGSDGASHPATSASRFLAILEENLAAVIGAQERTPSIEPTIAVQSLLGIVHWGISAHRAESRLSRDEAIAQITFLALHGLVAPAPRAEPAVRPLAQPRRWSAGRLRGLRQAS